MKYYLLVFCLFVCSCYSEQKANRQLNKAQEIYPKLTAKKSALWYPCEPIKAVSDSSQYKAWLNEIDSLNQLKIDTLIKFDTVVKYSLFTDCQKIVTKYRQVINKLPAIHDTIIKIDNAKIFSITVERDSAIRSATEFETKYKVFLKISFWLFLFLILTIIYVVKYKLHKLN
jgi:hypothetical protein